MGGVEEESMSAEVDSSVTTDAQTSAAPPPVGEYGWCLLWCCVWCICCIIVTQCCFLDPCSVLLYLCIIAMSFCDFCFINSIRNIFLKGYTFCNVDAQHNVFLIERIHCKLVWSAYYVFLHTTCIRYLIPHVCIALLLFLIKHLPWMF